MHTRHLTPAAALAVPAPTDAAVAMTMREVGGDVVLTASGTLNVDALMPSSVIAAEGGFINPRFLSGSVRVGADSPNAYFIDGYFGGITGGGPFGNGGATAADFGTGDLFDASNTGMFDDPDLPPKLLVPEGYVSGDFFSGTATWQDATFDSLGVTPGTYTWSWGSGATADSLTLVIPEPTAGCLIAGAGVLLLRRRV